MYKYAHNLAHISEIFFRFVIITEVKTNIQLVTKLSRVNNERNYNVAKYEIRNLCAFRQLSNEICFKEHIFPYLLPAVNYQTYEVSYIWHQTNTCPSHTGSLKISYIQEHRLP